MATLILSGKDYEVPELNFIALELAWPYIQSATLATTPVAGISASIMVIAAGILQGEDFEAEAFEVPETAKSLEVQHAAVANFIKRKLKAAETAAVKDCFLEVLQEAGLEVSEGELLKVLDEVKEMLANPSMEIAPDTLPSSSPQDAKEGAGTASERNGG